MSSDQTLTDTRADEGRKSSFFSPHMKVESVCGGSAMNQCEDREEGAPPSKTTLWGEHDSQTKAQRPEEQHRPDSPGPASSCVSFKSDWSMDRSLNFKDGHESDRQKVKHERPDSPGPEPSCLSLKSDGSMFRLIDFKEGDICDEQRVQQQRSEVPIGQSAQEHQTQLDSIFMVRVNVQAQLLLIIRADTYLEVSGLFPNDTAKIISA
ncbi:uncharacterized protein LOC119909422 [Xyrichtys novacula]|uniref:Uncharacterized protein LOC119909422 n=1 Tax=Xyrichtys novacula TaxID=13765 RepID=A0AAV1F5Z8_XYRNO|nr:uncharacterized protein LOC119909422 [Xyrichtys novacula]